MRAMNCAIILLNHADNLGITVTNLQLQKYLHFINAKFFHDRQQPMIDDANFETWVYGPTIPYLYNHFNFYGANSIDIDFERIRLKQFNEVITFCDDSAEYLRTNMDKFLHNLSSRNIFDLVDLTHEEPIWTEHKEEILRGKYFAYSNDDLMNVKNIL